jgi:hypothetical protein
MVPRIGDLVRPERQSPWGGGLVSTDANAPAAPSVPGWLAADHATSADERTKALGAFGIPRIGVARRQTSASRSRRRPEPAPPGERRSANPKARRQPPNRDQATGALACFQKQLTLANSAGGTNEGKQAELWLQSPAGRLGMAVL